MSRESRDARIASQRINKDMAVRFVEAVHNQQPVGGYTHNYYRYPARFSPLFARAAIEGIQSTGRRHPRSIHGRCYHFIRNRVPLSAVTRSAPMLTLYRCFYPALKRHRLPRTISSGLLEWAWTLPQHLNLHLPAIRAIAWQQAGCQRHVSWPIRKTIELILARIYQLPRRRQQRFARCLILKVGQLALDCRERIPAAWEFRKQVFDSRLDLFIEGMREYRQAVRDHPPPGADRRNYYVDP